MLKYLLGIIIFAVSHVSAGCFITMESQMLSTVPPGSMNIANTATKLQCASACTLDESCHGFIYHLKTSRCTSLPAEASSHVANESGFSDVQAYLPVIDTLLAQGKPAELFPMYTPGWPASNAVDGIYSDSSSLAHSGLGTDPWWRVDLQETRCIWAVRILNREDSWERTRNAYITVAESTSGIFHGSGNNLCAYYDGIMDRYFTHIRCAPPVAGRYVQIQFIVTDYLNLYEVEVHGV